MKIIMWICQIHMPQLLLSELGCTDRIDVTLLVHGQSRRRWTISRYWCELELAMRECVGRWQLLYIGARAMGQSQSWWNAEPSHSPPQPQMVKNSPLVDLHYRTAYNFCRSIRIIWSIVSKLLPQNQSLSTTHLSLISRSNHLCSLAAHPLSPQRGFDEGASPVHILPVPIGRYASERLTFFFSPILKLYMSIVLCWLSSLVYWRKVPWLCRQYILCS